MQRGHGLAVVAEYPSGACVLAAPCPRAVIERQILGGDVALRVEEVRAEPFCFGVVSDDLDPADVGVFDAAVRSVDDEESPGHPLVDVAGVDLKCWCAVSRDRFTCCHPLADQ